MQGFPSVLESINDLELNHINALLNLAGKFKGYSHDWQGLPIPFIKRPIVATSFLENSTRTKHSFAIAIKNLGATYIDFNADTSSLKKGESLEETLKTLHSQGVDLCIIRTNVSNELAQLKTKPPIIIVNGGDGAGDQRLSLKQKQRAKAPFDTQRCAGSTTSAKQHAWHSDAVGLIR